MSATKEVPRKRPVSLKDHDDPSTSEEKPVLGKAEKLKVFLAVLGKFIWDPTTREFMGRGGYRWFLLALYYVLYYSTLFAMSFAMFGIFFNFMPTKSPFWKWTQESKFEKSLIQRHPAVILLPSPNISVNEDNPLIWVTKDNGHIWGDQLHQYVESYKAYKLKNAKCSICKMPDIGSCAPPPTYGFRNGTPVFLFALTKIIGYEPEPFSSSDEVASFLDQPALKKKSFVKDIAKTLKFSDDLTNVNILCAGETPLDQELLGSIKYCSKTKISKADFPFEDAQKGYLSPVLAVTFPDATPGIPIAVECFPILKGLKVDYGTGVGYIRLEFMLT